MQTTRIPARHTIRLIVAACMTVAAPLVLATTTRSGEEVYTAVCAACHATGVKGAPRVGDAKAWTPRETRGLTSLTDNAIAGVRNMPPHGGNPEVTDFELKRAITYMVNQSGGHWTEPIDRFAPPAQARTGPQIVQAQCVKCHGTGVGGSPRIGDKQAWIARARPGLDSLVASAIHGHGGMPSRGGMADLTDAEMRSAVVYMLQTSLKETK